MRRNFIGADYARRRPSARPRCAAAASANVDRPGARADLAQAVAHRLGRDAPSPRAAASSGVEAERQVRRERRGVRAARAVRGAAGMALARDASTRARRRRRRPSASSRWPPVTTTTRGPERVHARGRAPSGSRRRAVAGQHARLGEVRRDHGRPRQQPLDERVARLGRRAARRPTRRPSPGRARPACPASSRSSASLDAPRSSRASPSIPIFTASTPMSSATARTCADDHLRRDRLRRASTPTVFCAVIAVIAVIPCTPQRANAFRSAWMPAPPPESEPAIDEHARDAGAVGHARSRLRRRVTYAPAGAVAAHVARELELGERGHDGRVARRPRRRARPRRRQPCRGRPRPPPAAGASRRRASAATPARDRAGPRPRRAGPARPAAPRTSVRAVARAARWCRRRGRDVTWPGTAPTSRPSSRATAR